MTDTIALGALAGLARLSMPRMPEITFAAEEAFKILRKRIETMTGELDAEHELVAVCLGAPPMHLERFGWDGRYLLWFKGETADGERAELYQHVSQLTVMLVVMNKTGPAARRVGFEVPSPGVEP